MENYKVDCLILGGGVAGLAIGSEVSKQFNNCLLVERNNKVGQETSSRNSEVIHAGIYYGKNTLRSQLCVSGKHYLYEYLDERNIQHKKCGKFILSSNESESQRLYDLKINAADCGVDDLIESNPEIDKYNFLSYDKYLFSPSTGIFDSHNYMECLKGDFTDNGGIILLGNKVQEVIKEKEYFKVHVKDLNNDLDFYVNSKILINCLGLTAVEISNSIHDEERYSLKLMKGDYYTYLGKEKLSHLIYPLPKKYSLGTHATIDLGRGIKFGPSAYQIQNIDYDVSEDHKAQFLESIRTYWPDIDENHLKPDYSGIRPLINGQSDFVIESNNFFENILIDILGYSSPGLTSSLSTAKYVSNLINKI